MLLGKQRMPSYSYDISCYPHLASFSFILGIFIGRLRKRQEYLRRNPFRKPLVQRNPSLNLPALGHSLQTKLSSLPLIHYTTHTQRVKRRNRKHQKKKRRLRVSVRRGWSTRLL